MCFSEYINSMSNNVQLIQYFIVITIFFIMYFFNMQLLKAKLFLIQVDKNLTQNTSLYLNRLETTALRN